MHGGGSPAFVEMGKRLGRAAHGLLGFPDLEEEWWGEPRQGAKWGLGRREQREEWEEVV